MDHKIEKSSGGNFEPIPAGSYVARCFQFIDLGTQESNWQGQVKKARKCRITWELPTETKVFKEERGAEPFSISQTYTQSLHEKSRFRADLESWRGRAFTDSELENFLVSSIIGKTCLISVKHEQSNGKVYANVSAVGPVPKGMEIPKPVNEPFIFSLSTKDEAGWAKLSQKTREKIIQSPEGAKLYGSAPTHTGNDEEIPF